MAGYDGVQFYAVPSGGSFRRYIVTSHSKMAGGSGTSEASSGLQRIFDTDSSGSEELDPLDPDSDESWHPSNSSFSSDNVSDIGDFNAQNTYLMSCMKMEPKKWSYPKKTSKKISSRDVTFSYNVRVCGIEVMICKEAFVRFHGLQIHARRVRNLQHQMKQGFAVPKEDGRGKHGNYPHKFQDKAVQSVREFLNAIPKYNSHYSRQQNPNRVYLDCDISKHCFLISR
ncbi:uncharacterized protein LOC126094559 isoform X3 [Schistocerca cancellata]|nr:uncharacterized protein LOC126094559 isoform X3 [Schistocerca cancellata]